MDQIRVLSRAQEIPHEGAFCGERWSDLPPSSRADSTLDLMWSDPDEVENWAVSPRGAGWLFGGNVTREVCPFDRTASHTVVTQITLVQPQKLA